MKKLVIIVCLLALGGCSAGALSFSSLWGKKQVEEQPAALVDFKSQLNVQTAWGTKTGEGAKGSYLRLSPAVAGQSVYSVDAKGRVSATNASNGKLLWQRQVQAPISTTPAVGAGVVVVATADAQVIALRAADGQPAWRTSVSNEVLAAPVITKGRVLVKSTDGMLVALEAKSGKQIWHYDHGSPSLILRASSAPATLGDKVVAGFADGKLAALALSGQLLWERPVAQASGPTAVEQMIDIDGDPVITRDGVVYVVTYQGSLAALDLATGQLKWRKEISSYTGLAVNDNLIFVADANSQVWAFDRTSGRVMWKQDKLRARQITAPVVMGDAIVVGDREGYLHWLAQADGRFLARKFVNKSGLLAPPVVQNGQLYAVTAEGELVAYKKVMT